MQHPPPAPSSFDEIFEEPAGSPLNIGLLEYGLPNGSRGLVLQKIMPPAQAMHPRLEIGLAVSAVNGEPVTGGMEQVHAYLQVRPLTITFVRSPGTGITAPSAQQLAFLPQPSAHAQPPSAALHGHGSAPAPAGQAVERTPRKRSPESPPLVLRQAAVRKSSGGKKDKHGILVKSKRSDSWKMRWLVLTDLGMGQLHPALRYYKDQKSYAMGKQELGEIALIEGVTHAMESKASVGPHLQLDGFTVSSPDRDFICSCKASDDALQWVEAIQRAIAGVVMDASTATSTTTRPVRFPPSTPAVQRMVKAREAQSSSSPFDQAITALQDATSMESRGRAAAANATNGGHCEILRTVFVETLEAFAFGLHLVEQAQSPEARLRQDIAAALEAKAEEVSAHCERLEVELEALPPILPMAKASDPAATPALHAVGLHPTPPDGPPAAPDLSVVDTAIQELIALTLDLSQHTGWSVQYLALF